MTAEQKATNNAWQEVNPDTENMWNFREQKTIQGVYVAKKENVGENNSNIYVLNTNDGKKIGVWGSVVLDSRFEQIQQGAEVKIEYLGKTKGEKGGREYHNYKVYQRAIPFEEVESDDIPVLDAETEDVNQAADLAAKEAKQK